jgi:hypothetical protein
MSKSIICTGYGNAHRFTNGTVEAAGRLWFVCAKCRWNPRPVYETPKAPAYAPGYANINGEALNPVK